MSWLLPQVATRTNATELLHQGFVMLEKNEQVFDGESLQKFDSTILAVMLAWQRAAQARQATLTFQNLPTKLVDLIQVYGVADIIGSV